MQGGTDPHTSLATNHTEPKHYGGHSWPESGLNTAPAHMGRRDLETIFLPTFKAAVTEAGARSVMAAYNEIDGIPNANNEDLLYEHLRNQWGFDGFVLSDEAKLWTNHHTAASPLDAIIQFLTAGGNMQFYDFPHIIWDLFIAEAVEAGRLSESILDDRVADLLRVKMMLGLFDNPFTDPSLVSLVVNSQEHQDLALEAARKAIVLLKNDNNVLPLASAKLGSIALIGPTRDYSGFGVLDNFVTVLDGVSAKAPQAKIYHAWGSGVLHNDELQ
ncbi:betaglucosidase-related glycosidase, putative, partial [Acanthamoeba castellanii str. Neff]